MSAAYDQFLTCVKEIHDLGTAMGLLEWDQEVFMPPRGVAGRARQRASLAALVHDKTVDPALGDLIDTLQDAKLDGFAAANVREMKRLRDRAVRLPRELVAELARCGSLSQQAWVAAREKDDWQGFAPHLARLTDLKRQEAEAVGYEEEPYNALLDEYEPGARASQLMVLFTELRQGLVPMLEAVRNAPNPPSDTLFKGSFTAGDQDQLGRRVLTAMGFDFEAGRLDISAHPFTQGLGPEDVRITTRYHEEDLASGLYANLHEGGHALYEMGLPLDHAGEPAGQSVSLGIHESQSRLWENLVGRSEAFMDWLAPLLREIWPTRFAALEPAELYRAANTVRPSLVRIEADEVTYNLHIILRMEIERALVAGDVDVAGLPTLWREKVREYLDLEVPTDREGVLQDIHWAFGLFGYFPTYALGNLYASTFFAAAGRDLPDLEQQLGQGQLLPLLAWLRTTIHGRGSLLPASELCRDVTGDDLRCEPFLAHLRRKLNRIYNLDI